MYPFIYIVKRMILLVRISFVRACGAPPEPTNVLELVFSDRRAQFRWSRA
jgi:hypothetical protein